MVGFLEMLVFLLPLLLSPPANSYMYFKAQYFKAQCEWSCDSSSILGQN